MMKIVTYNIQFGQGRDGKVDLSRIVDAVQGADVIALQEVDRFWTRSLMADQVEGLVNAFPGYDYAFGAGVNQAAGHTGAEDRPRRPRRRQFGNLLLSREPIQYCRHHLLPKSASIGPLSIQRSALECAVTYSGTPIRFINTHLTHLSSETRVPQVRELLRIHKEAPHEGLPVCGAIEVNPLRDGGDYWAEGLMSGGVSPNAVMLGDFNCTPDAPEYELITGPISPYGGRVTHPLGFVDAWVYAGEDPDGGFTSDVKKEPARLDYAFVSAGLRERIERCWVDEAAPGSDHQPVWLELAD